MSLNTAFSIAQKSIVSLERQIGIVSDNVTNANQAGYTRKEYQGQSITVNGFTIPTTGQPVQAVIDTALSNQVNTQATTYQYSQTISSYLTNYSNSYGGTSDADTTLGSTLDDFTTALQSLESDPTQTSDKANIISEAQQMASGLAGLSNAVQQGRQQASDAVATTVTSVNDQLQSIYDLNRQIIADSDRQGGVADLVDARNTAMNTLSQYAGFQFTTGSDNQVNVALGGVNLVHGSLLAKMSYTSVGAMSQSVVYPGTIPGVTVNGTDVTSSLTTGTLGALVKLRDSTLPGEQNKLNSYASTLASTVNGALANGAAYPSQNTVTSTLAVTAATPLSATGSWRVAVTDSSGIVQSYQDLNLASYSTVGALVTALNGISGVTASVASGKLSITSSNTADGISLNQMNSAVGGVGATQYFGFNNLFISSGTLSASNISVNPIFASGSTALPTSTLTSGSITTGTTRGISSGDTTVTTALVNAMNNAQSFAAAGNFSATTTTLSQYASSLIADAAGQAASAKTSANTAQTTYNYLSSQLSSETGVNVDEESANLSQLQSYYSSTAQVLSTIRSLYQTLLTAYSSS